MSLLTGQTALVAGATRGAGRGIARALAAAGAFVYCTGRSTTGHPSPYNRPETIDETVELIHSAGGQATAIRTDHTLPAEVESLFARIHQNHPRLDIAVITIAGEDPVLTPWTPICDTDLSTAEIAFRQSLLSHLITFQHAARAMRPHQRGLIVEITENDFLWAGGNPMAHLIKCAHKILPLYAAPELHPLHIATVAITPGFLRSEAMLQHFGVTESNWRDGIPKDPNFAFSESPLFIGRAIAALAADPPGALARSGQLLSSWDLARHYQLTDVDGSRPDWSAVPLDFSIYPPEFNNAMRHALDLQTAWHDQLRIRSARFRARLDPIE